MKAFRAILVCLLCLKLTVCPVSAQALGLPTVDHPRYALILKDLQAFSTQLKAFSSVVGAARQQIETLSSITAAINDLQGLIKGGVRGIVGEIAATVGINDTMDVLKEVQNVYTNAHELINQIHNLPEEAKQRLKEIGLATNVVEKFLREGLMYDTLNSLGADQWKDVAQNPVRALKTGAFGVALARADSYLSPEQRGQAWADYVNTLTPEERARMGGWIGPQYVARLADMWYGDMASRVKTSADIRTVANKMMAKIDPQKSTQAGSQKALVEDMTTYNAAMVLDVKLHASLIADYNRAAQTINAAERERSRIVREIDRDEAIRESAAMMSAPRQ